MQEANSHDLGVTLATDNVAGMPPFTAPKICHNLNCEFQTFERLAKCPKCRRPLLTAVEFRIVSSVLVVCGGLLLIMGVGFAYITYRNLAPGGRLPVGYETGVIILGLLSIFFSLFGMIVTSLGIWQVLFGVGNRRLLTGFLICIFTLAAIIALGKIVLLLLS